MNNIETFKVISFGGYGFWIGTYAHFCRDGLISILNLPSNVKAFTLKVSTQPLEGYTRLSLRSGEYQRLVVTTNDITKGLYPFTSKWVMAKFKNIKELWVKVTDIVYG